MERAREEQKGEHPVEHRLAEVETAQKRYLALVKRHLGYRQLDANQRERSRQRHDQEADRMRQTNQDMVDPSEQRRDHEQQCDKVEG